jgi:hypothetical protein
MPEDPESNLEQWKETMQAEHKAAIVEPSPDENHRIEGVSQVSYRVYFDYDADSESLERSRREQVDDLTDPELLSCACGVRGMTAEEATEHISAARDQQ